MDNFYEERLYNLRSEQLNGSKMEFNAVLKQISLRVSFESERGSGSIDNNF